MKRVLIGLMLTALCASNAYAYLDTGTVLDWVEQGGSRKVMADAYLGGVAEAYFWQWTVGGPEGKALVCFPEGQGLQTEELQLLALLSLKKIINKLGKDSEQGKEFLKGPLSMNLLVVWSREFPCR